MQIKFDELKTYFKQVAPHVSEDIMDDWLRSGAEILKLDIERVEKSLTPESLSKKVENSLRYSIKRLSTFNPRDMGVLYVSHNGGFVSYGNDDVHSVSTVVQEKLAMTNVQSMPNAALRSMRLKDDAIREFLKEMHRYELKPLDALVAKVKSGEPWDEYPWMSANIGGLYKDKFDKVWMVDFRIPKNHEKAEAAYKDIGDGSRAAMAQNKAFIEGKYGVKIDHCAAAILSVEDFSCMVTVEPINDDLCLAVKDIGDYYYNEYVQKGIVPVVSYDKEFETVNDMPSGLKGAIAEYALYNKLASESDKMKKTARSRVEELLQIQGVNIAPVGKKTQVGAISFSTSETKPSVDSKLLMKKFVELGGNPEDPEIFSQSKSSTRLNVTRSKNHVDYGFITNLASSVESLIKDSVVEMKEIHNIHEETKRNFDPTEPGVLEELEKESKEKAGSYDDELELF
ncbi:hypothetical protein P7410_17265 [Vibrio parahaemolyticus]|uniref:hypothetical protein n=1 Tax=Vibrio parahaemolyticus TaxID=670 RepID=UPI00235E580F|nr:hypothetical protein [Vibrio parahaemolyticus]MDG3025380.1 hypothetical protein [Vibrio parahaemolyticus]